MARLHRLTLQTLASCWLAQALLAAFLHHWLPIPVRPLVVDRGGCTAARWADLLRHYSALHRQDRLGQQRFSPVIQVSVFGERRTARPPAPDQLGGEPVVGVREEGRLAEVRRRHPSALELSCPTGPSSPPA